MDNAEGTALITTLLDLYERPGATFESRYQLAWQTDFSIDIIHHNPGQCLCIHWFKQFGNIKLFTIANH
jgi:hypothetical protein